MKKLLTLLCLMLSVNSYSKTIDVLIVTGQSDKYHYWPMMSDTLVNVLAQNDIFKTDVAVMKQGEDFSPKFKKYDVVIINVNDAVWSDGTKADFEKYMAAGGGMVVIHEADNAFPEWKEYNRMIGLGGWQGRNEKDGPYYYYKDGEYVKDYTPGKGGSHGKKVPFVINNRDASHPVMQGLPSSWNHINDELYSNLRGPAENIHVLATAYSDAETGGSGKEEPIIFTVDYHKGRVFHLTLGHTRSNYDKAMANADFKILVSRGVEWAATQSVGQPAPTQQELER